MTSVEFAGDQCGGGACTTVMDGAYALALPGYIVFTSNVPDSVLVDAVSGTALLAGNHFEAVDVRASTRGHGTAVGGSTDGAPTLRTVKLANNIHNPSLEAHPYEGDGGCGACVICVPGGQHQPHPPTAGS